MNPLSWFSASSSSPTTPCTDTPLLDYVVCVLSKVDKPNSTDALRDIAQDTYRSVVDMTAPAKVKEALAPLELVSKGLFAIQVIKVLYASTVDQAQRDVHIETITKLLNTYNTSLKGFGVKSTPFNIPAIIADIKTTVMAATPTACDPNSSEAQKALDALFDD